ncbi:hypothetical protein MPSEU_000789900 [Mayamaea pseudoterrestris]|nr:hypothetical protein MPSEU_000789900 [Mayamaea pseudoterrestris]
MPRQEQRRLLGCLAIAAACFGTTNAFTSHPYGIIKCRGHCQNSLTSSSMILRVSKSSITERPKTISKQGSKADINVPFYQQLIPRHGGGEHHNAASKHQHVHEQVDSSSLTESSPPFDKSTLVIGAGLLAVAATILGGVALQHYHIDLSQLVTWCQQLLAHPQETLQAGVDAMQAMGPLGVVAFGFVYCLAEVLAVPATPLTLSAGYLFGLVQGTTVVLLAATCAACIAFFIGKTFLRTWVEQVLQQNPKFAKLDKAIGREGFKLLLLVRLSPLFPFALSNYLYGASSVDFASYFWGTLLGFAPGTIAYVYAGMVGKALTLSGGAGGEPWYVYAGGFGVLAVLLKLASDVASEIVQAIDDE